MKIAIIGSTGRAGSRIYNEAVSRGHAVTAISRSTTEGIAKDLWSLTSIDLAGFDVIVSAFGTWVDHAQHLQAAKHLDHLMTGHPGRWLAVGGAGSLYVAENVRLKDTPDFPEAYKPTADAMTDALVYLESKAQSNWSFFSPSADFQPGVRTGAYVFGKDFLLTDENGMSIISMEDYAAALLDVIEQNLYNRERFTAVRKK